MGLFRQLRPKHRIRVTGPATITVVSGRASVDVTAENDVKIDHDKPPPRKVKLTSRPRKG
jgi:hypothetical protein